jgi:hypothetical protein
LENFSVKRTTLAAVILSVAITTVFLLTLYYSFAWIALIIALPIIVTAYTTRGWKEGAAAGLLSFPLALVVALPADAILHAIHPQMDSWSFLQLVVLATTYGSLWGFTPLVPISGALGGLLAHRRASKRDGENTSLVPRLS